MSKSKDGSKQYKFYFNFPTANQRAKKKYLIHLASHKRIHVVGSTSNGILVDDFTSKAATISALKILIRKFRDVEKEYEIVYCPKCFPNK